MEAIDADDEISEKDWLASAMQGSAFDFLNDPVENIYTMEDGKSYKSEDYETQGSVKETKEKNPYNSEFVKKILQGDKDLKEGKGRKISIAELKTLSK